MEHKDMSQRDLAGILGWSQSRVAHLLTGRVEITVDDLAEMAFALGLSVLETVRDRGMEFCAEMTPSEMRVLDAVRALPQTDRDAFTHLLGVKVLEHQRRAAPKKILKKPKLS
jgi:transcriptional regulator with XRE-family HTH domain